MSDSNRYNGPSHLGYFGVLAAIVLACILVGGLTYLQGRETERRGSAPKSHQEAAKVQAKSICIGREPGSLFECVYGLIEASAQAAHDEQDLSAQQRAASSALVAAIISFLTLVVTGVGVWFVKGTLEATLKAVEDTRAATLEMQRANSIAREMGEAQTRCYIDLGEMTVGVNEDGQATIVAKVKNTGNTPARNLSWICEVNVGVSKTPPSALKPSYFGTVIPAASDYTLIPKKKAKIGNWETGMESRKGRISVYAIISWQDVFGQSWGAIYERAIPLPTTLGESVKARKIETPFWDCYQRLPDRNEYGDGTPD